MKLNNLQNLLWLLHTIGKSQNKILRTEKIINLAKTLKV